MILMRRIKRSERWGVNGIDPQYQVYPFQTAPIFSDKPLSVLDVLADFFFILFVVTFQPLLFIV